MTADEQTVLALLGYIYLQNARPDKAAVFFSALDALHPGNAKTLRGLALSEVRSAAPQDALETLDRLAMAGGIDAEFHLLRAQAWNALGCVEECRSAMQSYLQTRDESTSVSVQPNIDKSA